MLLRLTELRPNSRNAFLAGFLGWTFDAFDFFILTYVLTQVARDFHKSISDIALTLAASLIMRPVGALIFGLDGGPLRPASSPDARHPVLFLCGGGLGPRAELRVFLILRLLYGVGMGGAWGVGASLAMESVPAKWRGIFSGILQEGYALGNLLAAVAYLDRLPALGLASDVFHWRSACLAHDFDPLEG